MADSGLRLSMPNHVTNYLMNQTLPMIMGHHDFISGQVSVSSDGFLLLLCMLSPVPNMIRCRTDS